MFVEKFYHRSDDSSNILESVVITKGLSLIFYIFFKKTE